MRKSIALVTGVAGPALAYLAFSNALAAITAATNPAIALRFDKNHAEALVVRADALAGAATSVSDLRTVASMARASLRAQPINARALRLLSTSLTPADNEVQRVALLTLSEKLSRREFGTQILLIENGAQGDGIAETLRHYDIALTTEAKVKDTLYPILASAIEDSAINKAFANYLLTPRQWVPEFTWYKYETDPKSNALAIAALQARGQPSFPEFARYRQLLFERAVKTGRLDLARAFYARFKVSDPAFLTSTAFVPAKPDANDSIVRWQLFELPYIVPQFVQSKPGAPHQLSVISSSGARGVVASKLLLLTPGTYRLTADYADVALIPSTTVTWSLRCLNPQLQAAVWQSNGTVVAGNSLSGVMRLPSNCKAQSLDLTVSAAGEQRDSSFTVRSVTLTRTEAQ